MALPDPDSSVGHSFGLELDGVTLPITDVVGLVLSVFRLEFEAEHGGIPPGPRTSRHALTLVRPLSGEKSFAGWVQQANDVGLEAARRRGAVVVYDDEGRPVARYHLENAWPSKLEIGSLTASGTPLVVERLTVSYERCWLE